MTTAHMTNLSAIATKVANLINSNGVDDHDIELLDSDTGVEIDGCLVWRNHNQLTVWLGNELDHDMARIVQVAL